MKYLIFTILIGGMALGFFSNNVFASGDGHDHGGHKHGTHDNDKDKKPTHRTVEVVGEIMDIECYFVHPEDGQGEDHAACAKQCINKGIPTALRSDKKLYVLIGGNHEAPKEKVANFAGHRVVLTGILREKEGLSVIQIEDVKRAKANQKDSFKEIKEKKKDDKKHGHEGSEGSEGSHGH